MDIYEFFTFNYVQTCFMILEYNRLFIQSRAYKSISIYIAYIYFCTTFIHTYVYRDKKA